MNIAHREKIVVLGFLSHFPVAGVAWQTIHYLIGFQKLGYEVYYVEAHGCTPSKLMQTETDDGAKRAAEYIHQVMRRIGLEDHWAYHSLYDSRYFGLSQAALKDLYNTAALLINLHGSHLPVPELAATGRLVYLETDPVDVEIDLYHQKGETKEYLSPHCAFFTYGENLGNTDCRVPVPQGYTFLPTRQPVIPEFWKPSEMGGECFTTIGNWRQPWREFKYQGEVYHWSKHLEFEKVLSLPTRVRQPFELALSSYNGEDQRVLQEHGWRVRPALELSNEPDTYRDYIRGSRGEFTVAKDQNVRLRSGWFSDRAVTYLAAGRPVITQETGFSNHLPTGEGLFAFSTLEEAASAVESINADYARHRRAAREIAHEFFSYEVVLSQLLEHLGYSRHASSNASALPPDLMIVPTSRWPTRLPQETVLRASGVPLPKARRIRRQNGSRASIILVTHNGLPYTKMCLATLLGAGWPIGDELIFVDNGSTDGTVAYLAELQQRYPWIKVQFNSQNRGFASANNQGIALAQGELLILLNPDTLVLEGWREGLARWLQEPATGMVGPVTNRACNEAQIDAPYRTYEEMRQFARAYTIRHRGKATPLQMLAMFCVALPRQVYDTVGPLDERFQVGMFEDDDYARRLRNAGYKILCAEDVFVHHFGQASLGELCMTGEYDSVLERNRLRFEEKWGTRWKPHGRRITPEYSKLRRHIISITSSKVPAGSTVAIISKGDEELLKLEGRAGWHFPRARDGSYTSIYPASGQEAVTQLEAVREQGAQFLLIPKPAFWWLEHYSELKRHLDASCALAFRDEQTCLIFDLGGNHG